MSAIAVFTDQHDYYLYNGPVDMRKSIDGLSGIVLNELGRDPGNRDVFIFLNRRGTHIKLLLKETDGYTLFYRRLHKGRFRAPDTDQDGTALRLTATELWSLLYGLSLQYSKKTG